MQTLGLNPAARQLDDKRWSTLEAWATSDKNVRDLAIIASQRTISSAESAWDVLKAGVPGIQAQSRVKDILRDYSELLADIPNLDDTVPAGASSLTVGEVLWGSLVCSLQLASNFQNKQLLATCIDLAAKVQQPLSSVHTLAKPGGRMVPRILRSVADALDRFGMFLCSSVQFFRVRNKSDQLALGSWSNLEQAQRQASKDINDILASVKDHLQAEDQRRMDQQLSDILAKLALQEGPEAKEGGTPSCLQVIPYPPNGRFFGRTDVLDAIDAALGINDSSRSPQKAAVLHGIGGVGKTQIALQYMYSRASAFPILLWVSADSRIKLAEEYHKIARAAKLVPESEAVNVEASRDIVKNWLSACSRDWLLVFDNVDDESQLKLYWPSGVRGAVLVTTRNPLFALTSRAIEVEPFSTKEGAKFLSLLIASYGTAEGTDTVKPSASADEEAISERLGGLPLAINQMAALMVSRAMSRAQFRDMYEKYGQKYNSMRKTGSSFYYSHTISTVWELSQGKLTPRSKAILGPLSFFDLDSIPAGILRPISTTDFQAGPLTEALSDEEEILEAVGGLIETALVKRLRGMDGYVMHRLVSDTTQKNLDDQSYVQTYKVAVHLVNALFPKQVAGAPMVKLWPECEKHLRQVLILVDHYRQLKQATPALEPLWDLAEMISNAAWYMDERGLGHLALDLVNIGLANCGPERTWLEAHLHNTAGTIYAERSDFSSALEHADLTRSIYASVYGEESLTVAGALNNIGNLMTAWGKYDEALVAHKKAISIRKRPHDDIRITLGQSYSNLCHCLILMGRLDEAREAIAEAEKYWIAQYGRRSMPVAKQLYNEGNVHYAAGDLDKALEIHLETLSIREEVLRQHEATAASSYKVACILHEQGRLDEAEEYLHKTLEACGSHSAIAASRARTLYHLGSLLATRHEGGKAKELKEKAANLRKEAFGVDPGENDSQEGYDAHVWLNYR